ncbi:MAG: HNH endonuclease signature motif containing protein [Dehalococcoidia bacterium]|nr:HNH endonuclease signature motif containing protein [Dehalococcoidia bacterium]
MGWIIVAVIVGLLLGVGVMLALAKPDAVRPRRRPRAKAGARVGEPVQSPAVPQHSEDKAPTAHQTVSRPEPAVPAPTPVPAPEKTAEGKQPLDFPEPVLRAAWRRQGGLCAHCGRLLIWENRNRDSGIGAWQSHHRIPRDQGGRSDLNNCVLFCSGAANCHFNVGHGGMSWNHYATLDDSGLLYLRSGAENLAKSPSTAQAQPGLIRQIFGLTMPGKLAQPASPAQPAKRSRRPRALQDDYDEAY